MSSEVVEEYLEKLANKKKEEDSLNKLIIQMSQRIDQLENRIEYLELKIKEGGN